MTNTLSDAHSLMLATSGNNISNAFMTAVSNGLPDAIIAFHAYFPQLSEKYPTTPVLALIQAVLGEKGSCIDALLQCFPDILTTPQSEQQIQHALFNAIQYGRINDVKKLREYFRTQIESIVHPNDTAFTSALLGAAANGYTECIRALHESFPQYNPENGIDEGGNTALILAAEGGHDDVLKVLVDKFPNIDANAVNVKQFSAISKAVMGGHTACVETLISSYQIALPHVIFAHTIAESFGHTKCMLLLESRFPNQIPLAPTHPWFLGAINGDYMRLKSFQQQIKDGNIQNIGGKTALMFAAGEGKVEYILSLKRLYPNVDINIQDKYGRTALMHAIEGNRTLCIGALVHCFPNIDPNLTSWQGNTALILAALHGHTASIRSLAKDFPQLNTDMLNIHGYSALHVAVASGRVDTIAILHETFPNLNPSLCNSSGITPLHLTASHVNNTDCIYALEQYFPSIDPNIGEMTVLMKAVQYGNIACIHALQQLFPGIDINKKNETTGQTALLIALDSSNSAVITALGQSFASTIDVQVQNNHGDSFLTLSAQRGQADCLLALQTCFPHTFHFLIPKYDQETACIIAIKAGHARYIIALAQCFPNIDYNGTYFDGCMETSMLECAITSNHPHCIAALHHCCPELHCDEQLFLLAVKLGYVECITVLFQHFPHIDSGLRSSIGKSALMLAVSDSNNVQVISALLSRLIADKN